MQSQRQTLTRELTWLFAFHIVKNLFRHRKVRYKALDKEHGSAVRPVRLDQPDDREELAAADSWEQSANLVAPIVDVLCKKSRDVQGVLRLRERQSFSFKHEGPVFGGEPPPGCPRNDKRD